MLKVTIMTMLLAACAHRHLGLLLPPPERDKQALMQCQTDYQNGVSVCFYANGDCAEAMATMAGSDDWTSIRKACVEEGHQQL